MADSLFEAMARAVGGPISRRTVFTGSVVGATTATLSALRLPASAQELTTAATPGSAASARNLLPSWSDSAARDSILAFLDAVTDESSDAYVEPAARVAAFDNDGTLWCEMPYIPQFDFVLAYIREQAQAHPELRTVQPYKAIWEQDASYFQAALDALAEGDLETVIEFLEVVMSPFAGLTPAEYEAIVQAFFDQATHPELQVPYRQVIYQPMVELVQALQDHAFDVFIVTGGGRDFVRVISDGFYGIARSNVIGSSIDLSYQADERGGVLIRRDTMDQPFDDGPGKPIRIEMQVGRQPILVGGNSDGDVAMLAYANEQHSNFLGLLVHHDDADREYAYDDGAETALELAAVQGWTVISMKEDFATVFPPGDA